MANELDFFSDSEDFNDRFMFFRSYYESLKELSPEELKQVLTAICEKAFYNNEIELTGYQKAIYLLIEPVLLRSIEKSKSCSERGKKGGRPLKEKANESQTKANESQIKANECNQKAEMEKENGEGKWSGEDKDSEHSTSTNRKRFIPPTLEEVQQYCQERENNINAENFIDYYSSVGWKVGNRAMKDWKAAVRNWEHRKHDFDKGKSKNSFNNCMTNSLSGKELSELEKMLLDN